MPEEEETDIFVLTVEVLGLRSAEDGGGVLRTRPEQGRGRTHAREERDDQPEGEIPSAGGGCRVVAD